MMAATVIHFGIDDLHRIPVLRQAGYVVEDCLSVRSLHSALIQYPDPDAVAMAESDAMNGNEAISLVRSHSTAPLVLFQGWQMFFEASEFNLVVPRLTHPRVWLVDLADLIERSRAIRSRCQLIREQTVLIREQVRAEVTRSRREMERSQSLANQFRFPDPYSKG
jgi:hypothetical protein